MYRQDVQLFILAGHLTNHLDSNPARLLDDVLETCIKHFDLIRDYEKMLQKQHRIEKACSVMGRMFVGFEQEINFNIFLGDTKMLFLTEDVVINTLLEKVTDVVMLNNFLALAAFHGKITAVEILISRGADDFETARKLAALGCQTEVLNRVDDFTRSQRCIDMYINTDTYKNYYEAVSEMRREQDDAITEFLFRDHLENLLQSLAPDADLTPHYGSLTVPIAMWGAENFFSITACLDWWCVHTLASHYKNRFSSTSNDSSPAANLLFTPTPPTSPSSVDTFSDSVWDEYDI